MDEALQRVTASAVWRSTQPEARAWPTRLGTGRKPDHRLTLTYTSSPLVSSMPEPS